MLKVKNLNKSYTTGGHTYPVLKNVSLHIQKGEFVAVMGGFWKWEDNVTQLYFLFYSA